MIDTLFSAPWVQSVLSSGTWLLICGCLFGALQLLNPIDPDQKTLREDLHLDLFYWFAGPLALGGLATGLTILGFYVIFAGDLSAAAAWSTQGAAWLRDWPLWAQALGVLIVTDISLYWSHRMFHNPSLWRYHAIHHAPESLDWMHAVRFHPVNLMFHSMLANALALWIGFPPASIAALGTFNVLYSCLVHTNVNWTFGPLRHVFASPVFHRWHHTSAEEGGSKNFAATFSCLDHLFGTFYMPKGVLPLKTGLTEADMPASIIGHLTYPLTRKGHAPNALQTDRPNPVQSPAAP